MVAQKIPEKQIKSQKIAFNWGNMGQWQEDVFIRYQHKTYEYVYNMGWQDKEVSLTIYKNRSSIKDANAPYPQPN